MDVRERQREAMQDIEGEAAEEWAASAAQAADDMAIREALQVPDPPHAVPRSLLRVPEGLGFQGRKRPAFEMGGASAEDVSATMRPLPTGFEITVVVRKQSNDVGVQTDWGLALCPVHSCRRKRSSRLKKKNPDP